MDETDSRSHKVNWGIAIIMVVIAAIVHKWWLLAGFGVFGGVLILNGYFPGVVSGKRIGVGLASLFIAGLLVFLGWYLGRPRPPEKPEIAKKDPAPLPLRPFPAPPTTTQIQKPKTQGGPKKTIHPGAGLSPQSAQVTAASVPLGKQARAVVDSTPTTPGSISQTNSGGVNVQQGTTGNNSPIINSPVTIGSTPKSISPQEMADLKAFLANAQIKTQVSISADQFSSNTPFPEEFYSALRDSGWGMKEAGVSTFMGFPAPGKRFQGAIITHSCPN